MSEEQSPAVNPLIIVGIGGVILVGLLFVVGALLLATGVIGGGGRMAADEQAVVEVPTLEQGQGGGFPTATPLLPTETPLPTDTPEPSATPSPEFTATAEPTHTAIPQVQPTNPPATTAPTSTPVPATDTPVPAPTNIKGLTSISFSVDNPTVGANQRIQFRFSLSNPTDNKITLGYAGVAIIDAAGAQVAYHTSWTNWIMDEGKTENWVDGVTIGAPGNYTLQFTACFPDVDACASGVGEWFVMAPPIAVTVQ